MPSGKKRIETRFFDFFDFPILLCHQSIVILLQLFRSLFEFVVSFLEFLFFLLDQAHYLVITVFHNVKQFLFGRFVTGFYCFNGTRRFQLCRSECCHIMIRTTTIVILQCLGITILYRWEATDPEFVTQFLPTVR